MDKEKLLRQIHLRIRDNPTTEELEENRKYLKKFLQRDYMEILDEVESLAPVKCFQEVSARDFENFLEFGTLSNRLADHLLICRDCKTFIDWASPTLIPCDYFPRAVVFASKLPPLIDFTLLPSLVSRDDWYHFIGCETCKNVIVRAQKVWKDQFQRDLIATCNEDTDKSYCLSFPEILAVAHRRLNHVKDPWKVSFNLHHLCALDNTVFFQRVPGCMQVDFFEHHTRKAQVVDKKKLKESDLLERKKHDFGLIAMHEDVYCTRYTVEKEADYRFRFHDLKFTGIKLSSVST